MINILKLRQMEKEKAEGTNKKNPDEEVVSLDEGKVVESADEKKEKKVKSDKDNKEEEKKKRAEAKAKKEEERKLKAEEKKKKEQDKKKREEEKKKKAEEKKKKEEDKKKKAEEKKRKEEEKKKEKEKKKAEKEKLEEEPEVIVNPQITDAVTETEEVPEEKPEESEATEGIDAEEAFRQKLMEELLAEDFSVEPTVEEWPQDIFGSGKSEAKPEAKSEEAPAKEEPKTEEKPKPAGGEEDLPELSPEEQAEVDRKKAETLAKFMSKTSPKTDEPEEENAEQPQAQSAPAPKPEPQKPSEPVKEEAKDSKPSVKKEDSEKNKKIENTVQLIGFNLGEEVYGVDINCIREINRITSITIVPNVPDYVEGVINLRGNVIPIINLRVKTKMPKKEFDSNTRVIIIEGDNLVVGFIVDAVKEVLRIPESIITPPPPIAVSQAAEYIKSVARTEGGLIILLDTDKLLDRKDFL